MSSVVQGTHVFCGPERGVLDHAILRYENGLIRAIEPQTEALAQCGRRLLIPALVNAHDHARPAMSSFGACNMPLETWIARSAFATPPEPYLAAAVSLARSARAGCAAMMVHYTRPSGTMPMTDEAVAIARAACDVGIRLAFALAIRDQNPIVYGRSDTLLDALPSEARATIESLFVKPASSPGDYLSLVDDIASAIASPMVDVQYGPAGVQWCSVALLEAIAEASARTGRRVHMHLLETVYQRHWADEAFPQGIVRFLKDIGLLSSRLTLAHCVHARPAELEMIAEARATIVTNFSSNLHLHSGFAPIADAYRRGCRIAMGVDGVALDEDDDAIREMRLIQMSHDGQGFNRTWSRADFLDLVVGNGRVSTGAPGRGRLAVGEAADFIVLDYDAVDCDSLVPSDPLDMLFARGNQSQILEVVVGGRTIARCGQPTGIDLPAMEAELRDRFRAGLPRYKALETSWVPFEAALRGWFQTRCDC